MTATCLMAVAGDLDDAQSAGPDIFSHCAAEVKGKELPVGVGGGVDLETDEWDSESFTAVSNLQHW